MLSKKTSAERQEVFDRRTKHAADLRIQNDKELASCVEQGCAWHHANLTRESRAIVERAYKQGAVSVLFATSTLAAGVNLPARRVIFREPFKAHAMQADCMLTPRDYLQLAGRAGRTGIDSLGEAYLCYTGKGKGCTFDNLQTLLKSAPDPVISTLRPDSDGRSRQMVAALHEVINGGVVQSRDDLEQYLKCFLLTKESSLPPAHTTKGSVTATVDDEATAAAAADVTEEEETHQHVATTGPASAEPPEPPIKVAAEFAFKHLIEKKQMQVLHEGSVLDGTKLGKAAASSGVRPHDAVNVAKFLTAACDDGIVLLSHLEPIYLGLYGEPRASSIQQDHVIRLRDMLYRPGDKSHLPRGAVSVAKKHAPQRVVEAIAAGRLSAKKKAEVEKTVAAFYYALALMELCMDSTRLAVIAEQYKIDKGILQELMGVSAKRCSMFERFADGIELKDLACVFGNAKKTVGLGAQPEVVQLMAVKYMTKPLAVALCRAGICSVSSLAHATPYLIQQAIKKIQGSAGPEPRRKAHQLQKHARKLFRAMEEENQRELDRLEEAMANMAEREVAVPAEAEEADMGVEVQRNAPVASLGVRRLSASLPAVSHPRELSHGTGTTTTTTTASSDAGRVRSSDC
ncbi:DExH-box ATP-dependent RNA helicase [Pycnococcus provasolii]